MKTRGMEIILMKSDQCQVRDQGRSQGPIQVNVHGQCQIWDQNRDPVRYLEAFFSDKLNSCIQDELVRRVPAKILLRKT